MTAKKPPIPLRNVLDIAGLVAADPCDRALVLGSFWPYSRTSFESRLSKAFKACCPISGFEPHISALARFYAGLVLDKVSDEKFDWVLRVLSSAETSPETARPQSLLADMVCAAAGARNATALFFKSQGRPPMRVVDRLAGAEALKARLQYVVQDLFVRPEALPGSVLLLDDIANTGASTRVYAAAAKQLAGASRVITVNLAATRFAAGKDGRGMLHLDTSALADNPALGEVWTDSGGVFHGSRDCPSMGKQANCEVRFIAERETEPCPTCIGRPLAARRWWQFWH
jgi:hypothetical protein